MSKIIRDLWEHQSQMVEFAQYSLNARGWAWWLAGCATGKTLSAYALADAINARRTLVLTKKTIIEQAWGGNAQNHTEGFTYLPLLKGNVKDKIALLKARWNDPDLVTVANYETAALMAQADPNLIGGFDLAIADESHTLKTHNSKQSMALANACAVIPNRVAMTGTGWEDRPTDVFGQVRWLDGGRAIRKDSVASRTLGSWTNFFDEYVIYRTVDNIKIPIRYKNQEKLNSLINPFTIYLDSEDVLDLPPEMDINREVAWTPTLRKVYNDLEREMIAEYGDDILIADNAMTLALRLHQLTGGYYRGKEGGQYIATPKVDATLDLLDEIGRQPTVVFTVFETDVQQLKPRLEAEGYKVKLLIGGTYQHEEFQQGDGDVILVNLAAGNAGIELTRARYAIYYSIGNSRTNYVQSRARVRRPNSDLTLPITYYTLTLPHSVDEDMMTAMQGKGDMSTYLLRGLTNRVRH